MAVLGSIYMGIATVTEAAALCVLAAVLFAWANRTLGWGTLLDCILAAVKTTSMIILIVMGASFLSRAIGILGNPRELTQYIGSLDLSPYVLIIMLGLIYLLLGCILDCFSIVVVTLPIALPLTTQARFDPIWFGVFMILMVELSQINPPVDFNLLVIQGLTGETIGTIAKAAVFFLMILTKVLLTIFPQIVLYLLSLIGR